jgi:hypothetical protein
MHFLLLELADRELAGGLIGIHLYVKLQACRV